MPNPNSHTFAWFQVVLVNTNNFWWLKQKLRFNDYNNLATVVEGNQKALFSIAITPWCRGRCNSFPWIAPFYP